MKWMHPKYEFFYKYIRHGCSKLHWWCFSRGYLGGSSQWWRMWLVCYFIYSYVFTEIILLYLIFLIFLKWRNTNLNHFRGEVINGGFGLVLDGSDDAAAKAESMLNWDVSNGVARRYSSLTFQWCLHTWKKIRPKRCFRLLCISFLLGHGVETKMRKIQSREPWKHILMESLRWLYPIQWKIIQS